MIKKLKAVFGIKLRIKITLITLIATLITIFGAFAISRHFIGKFYIQNAKNNLVQTFVSCNEFFTDEHLRELRNGTIESLYGYIDNPSQCVVFVIDPYKMAVYSTIKTNKVVAEELKNIVETTDFGLFRYKEKPYTITNDRFDQTSKKQYYELQGILNDGLYIILRTPVDEISSSIKFAMWFYAFIALMFILIEVAVVLGLSNFFTEPIIEMSRIAKKMSNLDFNAMVKVNSNDEIGELGNSMNQLSLKLKRTISELKSVNLEMSRDIEERKAVEDMRSEFLAHASHELKTPLALIQGYAEGLKESVNDDPESRDFYCDVIIDESQKMNKLVMRLINLNELESGGDTLTIERFDIAALVRGVINSADILLKQKEAVVEYDPPGELYVWADSFKIEEVITNYYSNAIHYVNKGGRIRVWFEPKESTVRVCVFNEGNRIEDKNLEKVFVKFYKVDAARTRQYGGSGIGLSIVEAIMKAHHRDYGVYNVENGVVFYFELDTTDTKVSSDETGNSKAIDI